MLKLTRNGIHEALREFYAGGKKACTLDVMSIAGASEDVKEVLRGTLRAWLNPFRTVAREGGLTAAHARIRAEEAIVRIEGLSLSLEYLEKTPPSKER